MSITKQEYLLEIWEEAFKKQETSGKTETAQESVELAGVVNVSRAVVLHYLLAHAPQDGILTDLEDPRYLLRTLGEAQLATLTESVEKSFADLSKEIRIEDSQIQFADAKGKWQLLDYAWKLDNINFFPSIILRIAPLLSEGKDLPTPLETT